MKLVYDRSWKWPSYNWVVSGSLGILSGIACCLWMPQGAIIGAVLAVVSGFIINRLFLFDGSVAFTFGSILPIIFAPVLLDSKTPSLQAAQSIVSATPWQIIYVIPLQGLGYLFRYLFERFKSA